MNDKGKEVKNVYSDTEEITKILNIINGSEDLSNTTEGLEMVRRYNGVLVSTRNRHGDVENALELPKASAGL